MAGEARLSAEQTDSPEALRALDEAYDLLIMIGRRVLANQAREAAERTAAPPEPTDEPVGGATSAPVAALDPAGSVRPHRAGDQLQTNDDRTSAGKQDGAVALEDGRHEPTDA